MAEDKKKYAILKIKGKPATKKTGIRCQKI